MFLFAFVTRCKNMIVPSHWRLVRARRVKHLVDLRWRSGDLFLTYFCTRMASEPLEYLLLKRTEFATGKLGLRLFILPSGEASQKRASGWTHLAEMLSILAIYSFELHGALLIKKHEKNGRKKTSKKQGRQKNPNHLSRFQSNPVEIFKERVSFDVSNATSKVPYAFGGSCLKELRDQMARKSGHVGRKRNLAAQSLLVNCHSVF